MRFTQSLQKKISHRPWVPCQWRSLCDIMTKAVQWKECMCVPSKWKRSVYVGVCVCVLWVSVCEMKWDSGNDTSLHQPSATLRHSSLKRLCWEKQRVERSSEQEAGPFPTQGQFLPLLPMSHAMGGYKALVVSHTRYLVCLLKLFLCKYTHTHFSNEGQLT